MRGAARACLNVSAPRFLSSLFYRRFYRRTLLIFFSALVEMNLMKRLLFLVSIAALSLSIAACKSTSDNESANTSQPAATPAAEFTPPPGSEEISADRFQREVQQNPEDPVPHFNLGNIYLVEGKFAEAADEFKFVVAKNPKDVDALAKMGIAYASANRFDEAVDAYKRAVALSPESGELHQRLAEVYEKAGKSSEAAKERGEFERLQPNEHAKELYKAGKYEEALGESQKVSNKNAETYYVMGNALLKLNRAKDAASAFRQAASFARFNLRSALPMT